MGPHSRAPGWCRRCYRPGRRTRAVAWPSATRSTPGRASPTGRAPSPRGGGRALRADRPARRRRGRLPADADVVLNFAVAKSNRWGPTSTRTPGPRVADGPPPPRPSVLALLVDRVYKPAGHQALAEDAPLGDNHGVWSFLSTYSISKIATEAMARWGARRYQLPTTIAACRCPTAIGAAGPHPPRDGARRQPDRRARNAPSIYHRSRARHRRHGPGSWRGQRPCHRRELGGSDPVSIEEWCGYFGELTGKAPSFERPTRHSTAWPST